MKAPRHLKPETRRWWVEVVTNFELESHHIRLLTMVAESWDRCQQAREGIAEHGLTYTDRHGARRPSPEISIERDSRIAFARLLRELGLDVAPPAECRTAGIAGNAFRRVGS